MDLLSPGQLFAGRYRVERPLAKGGMGAIYVAAHLETQAKVALKVLLPHMLHDERARERFRHEARVAAQLRSEHIVRVHDAGVDELTDMPFLAMELLEGVSLAEHVEVKGASTRRDTVLYMKQVGSGLDRAHRHLDAEGKPRAVVHRDLKPDNLFLTARDDGSPLVKILDYGLAKLTSMTMPLSGEVKGTPEYMALEQLRGEAVSPQTDIWPLGLIAFFLLSGRCYWRSSSSPDSNVQSLFAELVAPHKPAPSERVVELGGEPSWPRAFDPWFLRCMSPDPSRRFASAGEAVHALEQALLGQPRLATITVQADRAYPSVAEPPVGSTGTSSLARRSSPPPRAPSGTPGSGGMPAMRAGDEQSGFDVSIISGRRLLRLCCWGLWTRELAERYREAVQVGMHALHGAPWYVLAEISRYPPQRAEVAAVHGDLMQQAAKLGMVRACSVVDSALTQMQIRRLAEESHMPELAFFTEEREAARWVTRS